jgi:16S rRNA (uracil1498-N3)-methyltransferase
MPILPFSKTARLFVEVSLRQGDDISLDRDQAHYLLNVLRMEEDDQVLVFNGRDGEWLSRIESAGKKGATIELKEQTRVQPISPDLQYVFAPIKHARLDYMVQKAVEMGVSSLQPVITTHTQVTRLNKERMKANAIEAAEQCGVLTLPAVHSEMPLKQYLKEREKERSLIFCDESSSPDQSWQALSQLPHGKPLAVLIGPEGGFSDEEKKLLSESAGTIRLNLGPRILRADTAAVAALAIVQAVAGDWLHSA